MVITEGGQPRLLAVGDVVQAGDTVRPAPGASVELRLDDGQSLNLGADQAYRLGAEAPVAADVGCDHGFLTAKLLEIVPGLTMLASDVSAPSLEKARRLLGYEPAVDWREGLKLTIDWYRRRLRG